jgi:hypothetical protein
MKRRIIRRPVKAAAIPREYSISQLSTKVFWGFCTEACGSIVRDNRGMNDPHRLPFVEIDFPEARLLAEYGGVLHDLGFVVDAAKRLVAMMRDKENDPVANTALYTAALVTYIRCFTSGKRIPLAPEIFKDLPGEPLVVHQQLKDTRDKHVAHSVNAFELTRAGALVGSTEVLGVGAFVMNRSSDDEQGVEQLGRLAHFARLHLQQKYKELEQVVLDKARQIDIKDLSARPPIKLQPEGGPTAAKATR